MYIHIHTLKFMYMLGFIKCRPGCLYDAFMVFTHMYCELMSLE